MLIRQGLPKVPKPGDLREWVSITKGELLPDDGVGFHRSLTLVKNVKAQVIEGIGSYARDGNSTSGLTAIEYVFVLRRDPQVELREGMFIVFENREYLIVSTKIINRKFPYVAVFTIDSGNVKLENPTLFDGNTEDLEETAETVTEERSNPFLTND